MAIKALTTMLAGSLLIRGSIAGYALTNQYTTKNFASQFDFFTDPDPTSGFVKYVDYNTAIADKLVGTDDSQEATYIGVDHTSVVPLSSPGRKSVRLSSKMTFNHGLFVADILHMPGGICGTWPAYWLLGSGQEWPLTGEIDILEGVNEQVNNSMTLHTNSGCSISKTGFSGTANTLNCDVKDPSQPKNAGCGISNPSTASFGKGFNAARGGVSATEWTSTGIKIWFFPRSSIPADINTGSLDPSKWGTPVSQFAGNCDFDSHFKNQQIIFDNTFCGQWAGEAWNTSSCAAKAPTCNEFVANNPAAFTDAYWLIKSLKVYTESAGKLEEGPGEKMVRRDSQMIFDEGLVEERAVTAASLWHKMENDAGKAGKAIKDFFRGRRTVEGRIRGMRRV